MSLDLRGNKSETDLTANRDAESASEIAYGSRKMSHMEGVEGDVASRQIPLPLT